MAIALCLLWQFFIWTAQSPALLENAEQEQVITLLRSNSQLTCIGKEVVEVVEVVNEPVNVTSPAQTPAPLENAEQEQVITLLHRSNSQLACIGDEVVEVVNELVNELEGLVHYPMYSQDSLEIASRLTKEAISFKDIICTEFKAFVSHTEDITLQLVTWDPQKLTGNTFVGSHEARSVEASCIIVATELGFIEQDRERTCKLLKEKAHEQSQRARDKKSRAIKKEYIFEGLEITALVLAVSTLGISLPVFCRIASAVRKNARKTRKKAADAEANSCRGSWEASQLDGTFVRLLVKLEQQVRNTAKTCALFANEWTILEGLIRTAEGSGRQVHRKLVRMKAEEILKLCHQLTLSLESQLERMRSLEGPR